MKLSQSIRPISYLKAHAAELISGLAGTHEALVITQGGKATAVLQDIHSYDALQESLLMLKLLAQSQRSLARGETSSAAEVFSELRKKGGKVS